MVVCYSWDDVDDEVCDRAALYLRVFKEQPLAEVYVKEGSSLKCIWWFWVFHNTTLRIWQPLTSHQPTRPRLVASPVRLSSDTHWRRSGSSVPSIPLISCGGISMAASLMQVYTGFGYGEAGAFRRIKDELCEFTKPSVRILHLLGPNRHSLPNTSVSYTIGWYWRMPPSGLRPSPVWLNLG